MKEKRERIEEKKKRMQENVENKYLGRERRKTQVDCL
jgi:hypothetical protein